MLLENINFDDLNVEEMNVEGLEVGHNSFDDTAIMYAAPVWLNEKLYCFYNGNDFGIDGIGLAELSEWHGRNIFLDLIHLGIFYY